MIKHLTKPFTGSEIDAILDSDVKSWFYSKFKDYTPAQKYALKEIHDGKNVLISSPTGSGKTLSAFLAVINELVGLSKNGTLEDRVYALYISPLKALNNDIRVNLQEPLDEIAALVERSNPDQQEIRVGVRTGDTTVAERVKQAAKPPHIFITTPESLAILLNSPKMAESLRKVKWVILDEVHSLAENKRGTHLMLSLERLQYSMPHELVRIGLSATIHPLEEVAQFLAGTERDCLVADVNYVKQVDIEVLSPVPDLIYTPHEEVQRELYKLLDKLIQSHKTTLVFTNTRSGTERVVYNLKKSFPEKYTDDSIGAHHSSLSKTERLEVEEKLKQGKMKVVVCSTSLELGIDIGFIDLVILLTSPKSVARCLQRIGRSGHKLHEKSKGVLVVMDRDDLVECVVMAHAARQRLLDRVKVPRNCLDVLSQHVIGMSLERRWGVGEAFEVVRRAFPFSGLSMADFHSVLSYLSGSMTGLEEKRVYGKIYYDENAQEFGRRGRLTRVIYFTNLGTIPDESSARVFTRGDKNYVGNLEEDFLQRLKPGDLFVLGGKMYEFLYARGMKVYVERSHAPSPTIPSWFSEQLPLSFGLAMQINDFRRQMRDALDSKTKAEVMRGLREKMLLESQTAEAVYNYFNEQKKYSIIPDNQRILVEVFKSHDNRQFYLFHTLFGRRVNDALSRYFAYLLTENKRMNVAVTISDNGFVLQVPQHRSLSAIELKQMVDLSRVEADLKKALEGTELLKRRFRHVAARSFLILRNYLGREKSVGRQQLSAHILFGVVKRISENFPVIKETFREILEDYMDLEHTMQVLKDLKKGGSEGSHFVLGKQHGNLPSPFAHGLVVLGYGDVMVMQDQKELLRYLHESVLRQIGETPEGAPVRKKDKFEEWGEILATFDPE